MTTEFEPRSTGTSIIRTPDRVPRSISSNRFRGLLEESVRLRLLSEVPLGVFLSGGLRFQRDSGHDEQDRRRRQGEDLQHRL